MRFEVAVVGTPFLDLTFEGLARPPRVGEELLARALHIGPGGSGMQAIGATRLGLVTALVARIGREGLAGSIRSHLSSAGVHIVPDDRESKGEIPVTALLSTPDGVAMATVLAGEGVRPEDLVGIDARALVLPLGSLDLATEGARVYAITGALEVPHVTEDTFKRLASADALILNAGEATTLSSRSDPSEAALELAGLGPTVIVTLGAEGALGAEGNSIVRTPAPKVDAVDATGAGDLFVSAYVWSDLRGADLSDRLAWACLYAALSVRHPTALAGAARLDSLLIEGTARGLTRPGY